MLNKYIWSIFALLIPSTLSNNVFISFGEKYHVTDYNINQYGDTNFYNFKTRQWENYVDNYNYIWYSFGNNFIDSNIDFIDCSRENSNIEDWDQNGLYNDLIQECINIGKTRSNNSINILFTQNSYSVEDFKDYSNVLTNLVNTYNYNINWFISIDTYGVLNNNYRNKLIKSIVSIINNHNNTYFGTVIDAYCVSGINQSKSVMDDMASFWYNSFFDFRNDKSFNDVYYNCQGQYQDTILTLITIALVCSLIISIIIFSYYRRKRKRVKYQIIEDSPING